jgi:hypothetical protein
MKFKPVKFIKAKIIKHAACVLLYAVITMLLIALAYLSSLGGVASFVTMVFFFAVMIAIPAENSEYE